MENAPNAPESPTPRTIGGELRVAREAAGLSIAEVAERTKIRPGILTSIEDDAHDQLPALTYTLGFVKAYARTVGLDPAHAGERYRRESQKGEPVVTMVDLQPLEERRLPSKGLMFGSGIAIAVLMAGFWAWGAGWLTSSPAQAPEPVAAEQVATPEPSEEVDSTAPETSAPVATAASPVTVTANTDVWLRIADGDESFFMGTMTKGQTMMLPAGRAWTLRTGRAGALDIKVGDVAIPSLGDLATKVSNISLKPEDLLARVPGQAVASPAPQTAPATR